MIVIADGSPLIALVNIGHESTLPQLFREIIIPPGVAFELADFRRPIAVRGFINTPSAWLMIQAPERIEPLPTCIWEKLKRSAWPDNCRPVWS